MVFETSHGVINGLGLKQRAKAKNKPSHAVSPALVYDFNLHYISIELHLSPVLALASGKVRARVIGSHGQDFALVALDRASLRFLIASSAEDMKAPIVQHSDNHMEVGNIAILWVRIGQWFYAVVCQSAICLVVLLFF